MGRTEEIGLTLDQIGSDVLFSAGGWRAATDWSIFEIFRDADLLFCLQLNFFLIFLKKIFLTKSRSLASGSNGDRNGLHGQIRPLSYYVR